MPEANSHEGGEHAGVQPESPNPAADSRLRPQDTDGEALYRSDEPLVLQDGNWDLMSVSPLAAMKMLGDVVQSLSQITGEIAPTPPLMLSARMTRRRSISCPESSAPSSPKESPAPHDTPTSPQTMAPSCFPEIAMGSPEAQRDEPLPTDEELRADAQARAIQYAVISRRFFLKRAPSFSLHEYLDRIHRFCPHSPGVYLAAAAYIHRLCITDALIPATSCTVHRLCLASIRIASKSLEDNKWPQERIAKVGGIGLPELSRLEISLCYLLDFDLFIRAEELRQRMWQLQQMARQGMTMRRRLSEGFIMRLPVGSRPAAVQAA